MLKATDFLCFWNSWVVATRVVAAGRRALLLLLLVLLEGALRFLQPTKSFAFLTTNQSKDKQSRDTREQVSKLLSFSILFLSLSCRVKNKKQKQKHCSAALAGVVVLSDIAATLRGPARCQTSQQHTARFSALSAIVATLRGPARCEVQRVAGHRSNVATFSALLAIAATLRRPARCWPSQQRCDI